MMSTRLHLELRRIAIFSLFARCQFTNAVLRILGSCVAKHLQSCLTTQPPSECEPPFTKSPKVIQISLYRVKRLFQVSQTVLLREGVRSSLERGGSADVAHQKRHE